ncbi:MAG: hypothetical protein JNK38_04785 [Acidobacteria bacterium]|nr:hypothetical protein [Acidobacteriota bacterium]
MKKQITTIVATLSLFIAMAAIGFAGLGTKLTADIPFDFAVNGKTLAAGKYDVTNGAAPGSLIIRNQDTKAAATVLVRKEDAKQIGKALLTFRRYGAQYFLGSVNDGQHVSEVSKSNAERKAARGADNLANNELKPEIVTINATVGQ